MDPTTWPLWGKILAGFGPLGLWCAWSSWNWYKESKAHHETRDKNEAATKTLNEDHAKVVKNMAVEFAVKLKEQEDRHDAEAKERDKRHHAEMHEMTDRLITTTEAYAEKNRQLTEKVTILVEALGRRGVRGG